MLVWTAIFSSASNDTQSARAGSKTAAAAAAAAFPSPACLCLAKIIMQGPYIQANAQHKAQGSRRPLVLTTDDD
jgi:hypothetical protein